MRAGLAQLVNSTFQLALANYYRTASHLFSVPLLPPPPVEQHPLYFFRGMIHFEPAMPFLFTLKSEGYTPHVVLFSEKGEQNKLRQWPENTVDIIRYFIEREELLESKPVFVGHSAGGLTAFVLGAMTKGASLAGLQNVLPGLESVPKDKLRRLAQALEGCRFISIATPFHGVRLNISGEIFNRTIVQPRKPLLLTGITQRNLQKFYREIGVHPKDVIHGNILSRSNKLILEGGLASQASNAVVHGALHLFLPFLEHGDLSDGIVPAESAFLDGPQQVFLDLDHLRLIETVEAAQALAALIRDLTNPLPCES